MNHRQKPHVIQPVVQDTFDKEAMKQRRTERSAVSATLAGQESWQKAGLNSEKLSNTIISITFDFPLHLENYICETGAYGGFIRDDAYLALLAERAFFDPKKNTLPKERRPAEAQLAREALLCHQNPERFSKQEKWCFGLVRQMAERRANEKQVEKLILQDFIAEQKAVTSDKKSPSSSNIIAPRFVDGFTEESRTAHEHILSWHAELWPTVTLRPA